MSAPKRAGRVHERRCDIMKKYRILTAVLIAALLCGCSKKETSDTSTNTVSLTDSDNSSNGNSSTNSGTGISSAPQESTTQSSSTEPVSEPDSRPLNENETFLVGLAGDRILKSEITQVFTNDGSDCTPEDLTEDNFSAVLCDGFIYVATTNGSARNNRDNADVYDRGNMEFTDTSAVPNKNYSRLRVGGILGELILKEAQVNFACGTEQTEWELSDGSYKTGKELGLPEIYFAGGYAKFGGKLLMTGYICRVAEDQYGVGAGDIIFVPSDGEARFPILSYRFDGDNGFYHQPQVYALSDLVWENEFGYMYLGNVNDTTADISSLPSDGSFVKARVTVTDLELNCGVNFVNSVSAEILDIEEL